jgi:hypothetical protein
MRFQIVSQGSQAPQFAQVQAILEQAVLMQWQPSATITAIEGRESFNSAIVGGERSDFNVCEPL